MALGYDWWDDQDPPHDSDPCPWCGCDHGPAEPCPTGYDQAARDCEEIEAQQVAALRAELIRLLSEPSAN